MSSEQISKGPNLILAGPGTGKTTFVVEKTVELIKILNKKEDGIVICTFTRKATEELKLRLYSKLPITEFNKINFLIGTIHSICFELLARYSEQDYGDYQILPEDTQVHFIYSKLKALGYSSDKIKKNGWLLSEDLCSLFNKITDEEVDISKIDFKNNEDLEDACMVYKTYKSLLKRSRLFDFATIQETFLKELDGSDVFRKAIANDFKYFFIDEYQDVNNIQNKIFLKLSEPNYNLTVVGDDDQSIYGFRGANIEHIHNFEKWFTDKGIAVHKKILSVNYRSTCKIVNYSNNIIALSNGSRENKNITAFRNTISHEVVAKYFNSEETEVDFIIKTIQDLIKKGFVKDLNEIGILFKSVKNHSSLLISKLEDNSIPFILHGAGDLFESALGLEFMALIDYYLAKDQDMATIFFDRLATIDVKFGLDLTSIYVKNNYLDKLEELFQQKSKFFSCIDLTYEIFKVTDLLNRYYSEGSNIGIITGIVLSFDDFSDFYDPYGLYSYLSYLRSSQNVDFVDSININKINLMTIHQAKGLEFPVVFMPSQVERAKKKSYIDKFNELLGKTNTPEEELRVFYVGATRAEDLLIVTGSKKLRGKNKEYLPSLPLEKALSNNWVSEKIDYKILKQQLFRKRVTTGNDNLILSYNKIRTFETCPLSYMYSNVWNLQTVRIGGLEYGSNVHKILETIIREIINGQKLQDLDFEDIFERNWKNNNFRDEEENEKFKSIAKKQIISFLTNQKDLLVKNRIFSVEEEFNVMIGDNMITGRFDAVFETSEGKLLIDFKTGDKKDYSSQLSFYSICFKEKHSNNNLKLAIYYLKDAILEYVTPNEPQFELDKISKISQEIKTGNFTANPGKHCSDCAYNTICKFSPKNK